MICEKGINALLKGAAAVTAIVSTRIHNPSLPQNPVYPAISFSVITATGPITHDSKYGPRVDRVQISCWAENKPTAINLSEAVLNAVLGFSGTIGGIRFMGILPASTVPMEYPEAPLKVHAVHVDVRAGYMPV